MKLFFEDRKEIDAARAEYIAVLANDLLCRQDAIRTLSEDSRKRARALIGDTDVDLNAKLDPEDD